MENCFLMRVLWKRPILTDRAGSSIRGSKLQNKNSNVDLTRGQNVLEFIIDLSCIKIRNVKTV